MAINLGNLRINFIADATDVKRAIDAMRRDVYYWRRDMQQAARDAQTGAGGVGAALTRLGAVGGVVVAAFGAAAGAAAALAKSVAPVADEITRIGAAASQLGTTVEFMSALNIQAEKVGMPITSLMNTMQRFTVRLGEAAKGLGEAKDAYGDLELDAGALKEGGAEQALVEVWQRLKDITNEAERAALATKFFGEEGANIMNLDLSDFEKMMQDLEEAGILWDENMVAKAQKFQENLQRITRWWTSAKAVMIDFFNIGFELWDDFWEKANNAWTATKEFFTGPTEAETAVPFDADKWLDEQFAKAKEIRERNQRLEEKRAAEEAEERRKQEEKEMKKLERERDRLRRERERKEAAALRKIHEMERLRLKDEQIAIRRRLDALKQERAGITAQMTAISGGRVGILERGTAEAFAASRPRRDLSLQTKMLMENRRQTALLEKIATNPALLTAGMGLHVI